MRFCGRSAVLPANRALSAKTVSSVGSSIGTVIVAVFDSSGSINQAAKACGVSHSVARRVLVAQGRVTSAKIRVGQARGQTSLPELMATGWSTIQAAREVGVNEQDCPRLAKGHPAVNNMRTYPDGRVVDYTRKIVYKQRGDQRDLR